MNKLNLFKRLMRIGFSGIFFYLAVMLAAYLGVEEKSWWSKYWDIITGGGMGAVLGISASLLLGSIGFVAGWGVYGAIGIFSLFGGGLLGGLGLGSVVNMLRNPSDYDFNFWIIIPVLFVLSGLGVYLSKVITDKSMEFLIKRHQSQAAENPSTEEQTMMPTDDEISPNTPNPKPPIGFQSEVQGNTQ